MTLTTKINGIGYTATNRGFEICRVSSLKNGGINYGVIQQRPYSTSEEAEAAARKVAAAKRAKYMGEQNF